MFAVIRRVAGLAVALVCLLPAAAWANGWMDPQELPNNVLFQADTTGATAETGEPMTDMGEGICGGDVPAEQYEVEKTTWFSFRGTGGPMYFTTSGSNFDTMIDLYEGPPAAEFPPLECNNDRLLNDADSQVELTSTEPGKEYLLQVGGCDDDITPGACPFGTPGPAAGTAIFAAVGNDSRSFPETIQPGPRLSRTNAGASTDPGELTSCGPAPLGRSVWFRFNAPSAGRATFEVTGFDTVIGVYRGSGPRLACNDNAGDANTAELSLNVTPGAYIVQVGGKGVGEAAAFFNFGYRVAFTPANTGGGGGGGGTTTPPPTTPTTPPVITTPRLAKVSSSYDYEGIWGATGKFTALDVLRAPAGAKITVTCKGKGCRKKRIVKRVRRAQRRVPLAKLMRRNGRLRPKTVVEIRVTAPGKIGKVFRFRIRSYNRPARTTRCLTPGAKRTTAC